MLRQNPHCNTARTNLLGSFTSTQPYPHIRLTCALELQPHTPLQRKPHRGFTPLYKAAAKSSQHSPNPPHAVEGGCAEPPSSHTLQLSKTSIFSSPKQLSLKFPPHPISPGWWEQFALTRALGKEESPNTFTFLHRSTQPSSHLPFPGPCGCIWGADHIAFFPASLFPSAPPETVL